MKKYEYRQKLQQGFTLIEMTLVAAIIGMILYMTIGYVQQRTQQAAIDRATIQIQQILNAGLSFYINEGRWPANLTELVAPPTGAGYLPNAIVSPWAASGATYVVAPVNDDKLLRVQLTIPAGIVSRNAIARTLAGKVPLGITPTPGVVQSFVNIPGENINRAASVNYAGVYNNGGCVPTPECPYEVATAEQLDPQIMVVPVSVSGFADGNFNAYPISSFTAYAIGPSPNPGGCGTGSSAAGACPAGRDYWRVCLQVVTSEGAVTWNATTLPFASIMAITRCSPPNEEQGSGFI